jgi:(2S)-methylsuccinyl-CoA dehydrogenase
MHYQTHLDWTKSLIERRLANIKAGSRNESASLDDYQQAIFDCSSSTAELGSAEALAAHARMNSDPLLEEMAELHAGMMVKSIIERLSVPILSLGEGADEPIPAALTLFMQECHQHERLAALGQRIIEAQGDLGPRGLSEEKSMMADTFQQFADEVVAPLAEQIHREDQIIPDTILEGLKSLGCFGLSVPEQYGGLLPNDKEDTLGMIVVTEELSRVSLGGAGSLITRPEILARAIMEGGTLEQKAYWLPGIASGETLCAVAITEPDFGSDVASMKLRATQTEDGWILDGAKTWSTFAGKANVLLTLARTDSNPSLGHKGLSLFLVEKPSTDDHAFEVKQSSGGKLTGKAIDTVGYRGMHSYQLFFDQFLVPHTHVIGEGQGLGRGFYFTMRGFSGGRIQTAARAIGLMKGAFDKALRYAQDRKVFDRPIADYQLSQIKIAKMAMAIAAGRQFTYAVGRMMDDGRGQVEASLVKLVTCKQAEVVTREAMQLHGGMGYAEETDVSRYWLDARVLSIFEGTEETLALKVVGRSLVEQAA